MINILLADVVREGTSNQSPRVPSLGHLVELVCYRGHPSHCPGTPVPDRALGLLLTFRCNRPPRLRLPCLLLHSCRSPWVCSFWEAWRPDDPENLRSSLHTSQANHYSYHSWGRQQALLSLETSADPGRNTCDSPRVQDPPVSFLPGPKASPPCLNPESFHSDLSHHLQFGLEFFSVPQFVYLSNGYDDAGCPE